MNDQQMQQAITNLVIKSANMFADGKSRAEVIKELLSYGMTDEAAEAIANKGQEIKSAEARKSGGTTMMIGAGICVVGLAITLGTHEAAASNGGGHYVIAYGAILGGAWVFLKGLWRSMAG
jgi:hypothetical protein